MNKNLRVFVKKVGSQVEGVSPIGGRYSLSNIDPNGRFLVCQGGSLDGPQRLWRFDLDSYKGTVLSPEDKTGWTPSVSWDGSKIVFSCGVKPASESPAIGDTPLFFGPNDNIPMNLFISDVDGRNRICRYFLDDSRIVPLSNDTKGLTRGAFVLQNRPALLAHSIRDGASQIWEFSFDNSEPKHVKIEGITTCGHPSMSLDGTLAFDSIE